MKQTGERWWLRDQHTLNAFVDFAQRNIDAGKKITVALLEKDRTADQNAMFYALYTQIASQMEDKSVIQVRAECKLRYGVVLLKAADPDWAKWYDRVIKPMSYEDKLFLFQDFPVTSQFGVKQGSAYIDSIIADYSSNGYALADPRHN